jgi:hypothetical protein
MQCNNFKIEFFNCSVRVEIGHSCRCLVLVWTKRFKNNLHHVCSKVKKWESQDTILMY